MTFLNAGLLAAGLASIAIPILIHLLMRRRRKPVMWGAMRFVMEAYRRTRRRLLLERWLLLAARCLLVALAALAIGRPILGALAGDRGGGRTVYLLVDNSLTAALRQPGGPSALERHISAARAVLSGLSEGDRAGLVLLGAPPERAVVPASPNLAGVGDLLSALTPTDARADLGAALIAASSAINESRSRPGAGGAGGDAPDRTFIAIFSDLLVGSADTEAALPKLPAGVRLAATTPPAPAAAAKLDNVTIRSATPLRSILLADQLDQTQAITVTLDRSGPGVQQAGLSQIALRLDRTGPGPGSGPGSGFGPGFGQLDPAASGSAGNPAARAGQAVVRWAAGQRETTQTVVLDAGVGSGGVAGAATGGGITSAAGGSLASTARSGVISVSIDADPLLRDNILRIPIEVRETLRVGIIGGPRTRRASDPESLTGSDWIALALRPREDAAVEISNLDASPIDAAALAGLDALVITTPDRISESDWPRLRAWVEASGSGGSAAGGAAGGVLLVTPPGDKAVHTWPDAMLRGLGLNWTIAREPKAFSPDDLNRPRLEPRAEGDGASASLLSPVRAELADLARPVNVLRILPVQGTPDGAAAELALADGGTSLGLVWVTSLSAKRAEGPSAPPTGPRDDTRATPATPPPPSGGAGAPGAPTRGLFIYVASALELSWTDLPVKPLMVPLVQELIRQGVGRSRSAASVIAGRPVVAPPQSSQLRLLQDGSVAGDGARAAAGGPEGQATIIPVDDWGGASKPIRRAGVWEAIDTGGGRRAVIVINPDPGAGDITPRERAPLEAWLNAALSPAGATTPANQVVWIDAAAPTDGAPAGTGPGGGGTAGGGPLAQAFQLRSEGRPTGAWILWGALALALAELFLARRASHAAT